MFETLKIHYICSKVLETRTPIIAVLNELYNVVEKIPSILKKLSDKYPQFNKLVFMSEDIISEFNKMVKDADNKVWGTSFRIQSRMFSKCADLTDELQTQFTSGVLNQMLNDTLVEIAQEAKVIKNAMEALERIFNGKKPKVSKATEASANDVIVDAVATHSGTAENN